MMTSNLDELLTSNSSREITLSVIKTLNEGGAIATNKMKKRREKEILEKALKELNARKNHLGLWVKDSSETIDNKRIKEDRSRQYTVHAPSPIRDEDDDNDFGPTPAGGNSYSRSRTVISSSNSTESKSGREDWMNIELKMTDPQNLLRQQAITSQKARSFSNHKNSNNSNDISLADSRSIATGRQDPTIVKSGIPQTDTKWNHDQMMAEEKIDKSRMNKILSEGLDSRFAPSSSSKRLE